MPTRIWPRVSPLCTEHRLMVWSICSELKKRQLPSHLTEALKNVYFATSAWLNCQRDFTILCPWEVVWIWLVNSQHFVLVTVSWHMILAVPPVSEAMHKAGHTAIASGIKSCLCKNNWNLIFTEWKVLLVMNVHVLHPLVLATPKDDSITYI